MRHTLPRLAGALALPLLAACKPTPAANARDTSAATTAVATATTPVDSTELAVRAIHALSERIERDAAGWSCREVDVSGLSTEGGHVRECRDAQGVLGRITAEHFGETVRWTERLYLDANTLRFAHVVTERSAQPFGRTVERTEDRFYFADDRMLRWLATGTDGRSAPRDPDGAEARRHDEDLAQALEWYLGCLNETPRGGTCEIMR